VFAGAGDADASAALRSLDEALGLNPALAEAAFNRALLLERLGRRDEALAAWDRYLAIDGASAWAGEARRHRAALLPPRQ
jgi:tetratricopeptide (TPR) repeat protein